MIYRIKTNSGVKYFAVEDGHIVTNDLREPEKWVKKMGGLEAVLAKAQPTEFSSLAEAWEVRRNEKKEAVRRQVEALKNKNREIECSYKKLIEENDTVPLTPDNIRIILAYLNTVNWGLWYLPKTNPSASFCQYDCDGHIVTTVTIDTPVEYKGMLVRRFKYGICPRGHLNKYTAIRH